MSDATTQPPPDSSASGNDDEDEEEAGELGTEGASDPGPPMTRHYVLTRFDGAEESWSFLSEPDWSANVIAAHPDGGAILEAQRDDPELAPMLVRFDAAGAMIDELELPVGFQTHEIVIDSEGRVFIAAWIDGAFAYLAYAADFTEHWPTTTIERVAGGVQREIRLAMRPDGEVMLASSTATSASLRRVDTTGNEVWSQPWPGPGAPEAVGTLAGLAVADDGTTVLAIDTGDAESGDFWLAAFDDDGAEAWAAVQPDTYAVGLAITEAGTVVALGHEIIFDDGIEEANWLAGYSNAGAQQWELRPEVGGYPSAVRPIADGFVVAMGAAYVYDDAGTELVSVAHEEPGASTYSLAVAVGSADGGVLLLGNASFAE